MLSEDIWKLSFMYFHMLIFFLKFSLELLIQLISDSVTKPSKERKIVSRAETKKFFDIFSILIIAILPYQISESEHGLKYRTHDQKFKLILPCNCERVRKTLANSLTYIKINFSGLVSLQFRYIHKENLFEEIGKNIYN